jgi:hypothetical protein
MEIELLGGEGETKENKEKENKEGTEGEEASIKTKARKEHKRGQASELRSDEQTPFSLCESATAEHLPASAQFAAAQAQSATATSNSANQHAQPGRLSSDSSRSSRNAASKASGISSDKQQDVEMKQAEPLPAARNARNKEASEAANEQFGKQATTQQMRSNDSNCSTAMQSRAESSLSSLANTQTDTGRLSSFSSEGAQRDGSNSGPCMSAKLSDELQAELRGTDKGGGCEHAANGRVLKCDTRAAMEDVACTLSLGASLINEGQL